MLVVAILHQPKTGSSNFVDKGLWQSRTSVLLMDETSEGAKCEELKKIVVDNNSKKFFQVGAQLPP